MIIFKLLRYKNFLSSGNTFTEVDFTRTKSTLVVGHNGAGKSTMLDALSFGLFGKPHRRISKAQLVNSINQKQALVEVEFTIGRSNFKLIRGIKPNIFEIWKDHKMINQSSHAMEYQKILEQNILKLNHKSFHQVVVLGSSSFIPFMQLNAGHRRDVIEDLLDINIFSKMNVILKEKNSTLKDKASTIVNNIELCKTKIEQHSKYIRDIAALTTENKKKYEKQIQSADLKIQKLQENNNILTNELDAFGDIDLTSLQNKKNDVITYRAEQKQQLRTVAKRGLFLQSNDECPTCEQPIQNKDKLVFDTKNQAYQIESTIKLIESSYIEVEAEMQKLQETIAIVNGKTSTINSNNREIQSLNQSNNDLRSYLNEEVSTDLNVARKELEDITNDKEDLIEEKLKVTEQINYNGVIAEMLRDTGIKTKIIKQYLPAINKLVNQHLQVLDFFVSFDLDESFQETIRSRFRDDFTYESFSEGEKQRIDLSLLFTWRQIAKMKNSVSTNLLILDETFDSSLDHDGVENLLKILNTLGEDTNTFIISHKGDILDGKFDSKIEFVKERNFSKMKI